MGFETKVAKHPGYTGCPGAPITGPGRDLGVSASPSPDGWGDRSEGTASLWLACSADCPLVTAGGPDSVPPRLGENAQRTSHSSGLTPGGLELHNISDEHIYYPRRSSGNCQCGY